MAYDSDAGTPPSDSHDGGGISIVDGFAEPHVDLGASCDPSWSVTSDGAALLVRDPAVLSHFELQRVLDQIIASSGATGLTADQLLRRLFDTENTVAGGVFPDNMHCDDPTNPAFVNAPPVDCPRAEGALASSAGLFVPDDPDYFAPIAVVNRFDLLPTNHSSCGEYRIVYAKWSGRSDPTNRVFLILEAAFANPTSTLAGCRPVAELLAGIDRASSDVVAEGLETLYFTGLTVFPPAVDAQNYGLIASHCAYGGACGQVRIGQGMQAPWEFRQFRLDEQTLHFAPSVVTNSPAPEMFDPAVTTTVAQSLRTDFLSQVGVLASAPLAKMRMLLDFGSAGQSALLGPAQPNYLERVLGSTDGAAFADEIEKRLAQVDLSACERDPVTYESVLKRATGLSCAGCHAPTDLLGPERTVGCGVVWPDSLGEAHIDEYGALSPALSDTFLPQRALELTTYLQACDEAAILANLEPSPQTVFRECFVAGTAVTMADGSTKPIEQIAPGEAVLAFDVCTGALTPAPVVRRVERPHADRLVVINETVVATTNHPFYSAGRWVRADALEIGTPLFEIRDVDSTTGRRLGVAQGSVQQLLLKPGSVATYNLEVAKHHTYFAGGLLVHDRP